ncbi:MAG: outer membrane protein assembly factor BamD [Bacteroidota bacterium]
MHNRAIHFVCICLSLSVLLSSCGNYEKVLKSHDVNFKLTKANEYYDKKEYLKANQLYEKLVPIMRNTRNYEQLYYRWSYSFYYMKDYLSASYHFKNFVEFFPMSKDADECEFMHGVSLFKMSPKYSLDQTNTEKALETLQSYVNTHPNSKRIKDANTYIDAGRAKLEMKQADAAKLYFNINQFKASGIAYKSVLRNFPESASSDFYQFMIIKSFYNYGKASVLEKQEERFAIALNAYHELVEGYPKSKYLHEAEKLYTLTDLKIKKIRNEHK